MIIEALFLQAESTTQNMTMPEYFLMLNTLEQENIDEIVTTVVLKLSNGNVK